MSKNKRTKMNILIGALIILLVALAVFVYVILYNGGIVIKKTGSVEVMNKLRGIQRKGGKFELTQNDIDELSKLLMPENTGKVTFKGANIEIVNDEILIKAPISYKKVDLLFSSKGKINFANGKITYTADNFKIGKLTIPKKLVLSQIAKVNNKNVYAEDNLIKINPSVIPFKINSFKVVDNKILGTATKPDEKMSFDDISEKGEEEIDKQLSTVKQKIQSATVLMNNEEKEKATEILSAIDKVSGKPIEEKKKVINDIKNTVNEFTKKATDGDKKKELKQISKEVKKVEVSTAKNEKKSEKQTKTKRDSLTKAKADLSDAYSQVKTSKEKKVISKMISTVSRMEANPSYDATPDQAFVKSSYSTLDKNSKNRVKFALFTNVDQDNAEQLIQVFGL